jgi:hypothetical protein
LNPRRENERWINPLLKQLDLVHKRDEDLPQNAYWRQIEEFELAERIGKLVVEVNRAAGHRVLEMVDYLPPQKNVLRVSFIRQRVKHNFEIAIRDSGIAVMFSTTRLAPTGWRRYISGHNARSNSTLVWEEIIYPREILEQNIQAWISYLLSGLDKKFRLDQILQASETTDSSLNAALRKISA